MKITGNSHEVANYVNESAVNRTKELASEQAPKSGDAPSGIQEDAIVNLSDRSREVQKAVEAVEAAPDIRAEEVQAIKDRIDRGGYEIDFEKTAEKMIKAFMDKMV
jgi:flagellar biosynthesis anti-sigma factor FlgM